MSNRDSLGFGELLPQDVIDIFAQEKHKKRGRKKRTRSFSRAFGLFKRKKKKNLGSNGESHGLGPALDLALDEHRAAHHEHKGGQKSGRQGHQQGNSHAVPKRDDDKTPAPPLFQENVFIESSRSKYVEDLHTEAQEGLKMMQQEESSNGMEFQDNESTVSTVTIQTDGEGTGFVTDSTIPDTSSVVSVHSSLSVRSSRSGLTRQGSTFRPLNSGKKSERSKMRRKQRKTVAGIPRHVQKELGLDRVGCTGTQTLNEEQIYNGETDMSPTTDGSQHEAESPQEPSPSLQASNIIHPLSKDRVKQLNAAHGSHRDDLALLHRLGPLLAEEQRPRSLATQWMTSASSAQQQPSSPVMTMSPQAAYLSKIIPNAVLPPSIDVVEISRSRSRSSVRTVSKSSLLLSSPAPSRASSRASSCRTSSSNITSASRYNGPTLSDTSCWSNSDSSETLVSNSSTISSSSTPKQKLSQDRYASSKENKVGSSHGTSNAKVIIKGDQVERDGQFVRSLSVMKSKRAPPPPSRSYSLHSKVKRRSRDLLEGKVVLGGQSTPALSEETEKNKPGSSPAPSGNMDSPGYHGDISSLDDSTGSGSFALIKSQLQKPKTEEEKTNAETVQKGKKEPCKENNVISPSSGYSSQNGTSPQYSKQPPSSSPKHKGFLAKLQFLFSGSSSSGLAPALPAQPTLAESVNSTGSKPDTISVSPSVQTLRELFNIPPPPKIHAPPPPPPEVWAHSRRTCELLLGPPAPDNICAIIKKNPKDRRQQRQSPSVSTESSVKSLGMERKHKNPSAECVNGSQGSVHTLGAKTVQESGIIYAEIHKENSERLAQNGDLKENGKDEKVRVSESLNGMLVKHIGKYEERLGVRRKEEGHSAAIKATESKTNTDTLPIISSVCISSSQLADRSVPPVQVASPESSWPPPPPPMSPVVIGRSDETDVPLPPPPLFGEGVLVSPLQVALKEPSQGGNLCLTAVSVKPKVKSEHVTVTTMHGPQKRHLTQEEVAPSLSIPPPPPYTAPPPPTAATTKVSLRPGEVSPPPLVASKEFTTSVVQDVAPPVAVVSSSPEKETPPPVNVLEVSAFPPKTVAALPPENFTASSSTGEAPESKLTSPPLPSQEIDLQHKNISFKPETKDLSNSVFIPPQNTPPPPPIEPLLKSSAISQATNDDSADDEVPPSPPFEFKNAPSLKETEEPAPSPPAGIPLPPPLPVQVSTSIKHQSSPLRTENQDQEKNPTADIQKEPATLITPSLLQMVKLRSVNSSPEPPEHQNQVTASCLPQEPTSIVTPSLLQMVKLRSVNNSPEPPEAAKDVKEEAKSNPTPSPLQIVQLRSVNNSPEPPEAAKDVKEEAKSNPTPSPLQIVQLRSVNNSPEPPEAAKDVKEEAKSNPTPSPLQIVQLRSVNNSPEPPEAAKDVKEEAKSNPTPSPLQMVQLRSVNNSPEPPEAAKSVKEEAIGTPPVNLQSINNPEHPEAKEQQKPEVPEIQQQPNKQVPTSSNSDVPQKPVRKSLILTSPPTIITSEPTSPKSDSVAIPPASSPTSVSPVKKSPTTTSSVSMNLQEAIRLRTAARSKEGPGSHFPLHSPRSPPNSLKSPASTASFIFSKSNKVVPEMRQKQENKEPIQKLTDSTAKKGPSEAESKVGVKVPPPVAKKPKAKSTEADASEAVEQTAGQEAQLDGSKDGTEEINGTAGTVQGKTSSAS